jgi:hypothetical protein
LADSVDLTHAPVPTNDGERLLFRNIFPTLVSIDCEGTAHPELASAWYADVPGRRWIFTLADSSDAAGPRAADRIISDWQLRRSEVSALGVQSASVDSNGHLVVTMRDSLDSLPTLFADPVLSITREIPNRRPVNFIAKPHSDPRDLLDSGADLLVSRDPALVEYAGGKSGFTLFPLPWSRTYIMVQPAGSTSLPRTVAGDAVRADSRIAKPPFWWEQLAGACAGSTAASPSAVSNRVVYVRGDLIAQGLAERIVALTGSGETLRAAALEPLEFSQALESGGERAFIMAAPRQSLAGCRRFGGWPAGSRVEPLIDTRATAIVRRGSPGLRVDWDGTPRVLDKAGAR